MSIDSLRKNLLAYLVGLVISMMIGVLGDIHRQIVNGVQFDFWLMLDAAIVVVPPILTNMLMNMKFPSVGHETIAEKVSDHEDQLQLEDPATAPATTVANPPPVLPPAPAVELDGRG